MDNTTKKDTVLKMGGLVSDETTVDPVSGNEVPPGSNAEDVRDDIDAKLSPNEYVVPADVLRFYGVAFFEKLRAKAKAGLEEMDKEGRIGGGTDEEDELPFDVEELQAEDDGEDEQAFAKGGVVNPEEQQILNAQPTFNPNQWGFGGTAYTPPVYQAPVNVATNPAVPAPVIPPVQVGQGSKDAVVGYNKTSATGSQAEGAQAGGNWAKDLDFTNPQSVLDWANKQAKGTLLDKGITAAGALLGGPLGAGLAGAVTKTNNIAQIRAAARLAADAGNTTLQTQLEDLADSQLEGSPVKSIVDTLATGNKYYESAVEAKKKAGATAAPTAKPDNKPVASAPKKSATTTTKPSTKPVVGSSTKGGSGLMNKNTVSVTGTIAGKTGATKSVSSSKGLTGGGKAKGGLIQKPNLTNKTK